MKSLFLIACAAAFSLLIGCNDDVENLSFEEQMMIDQQIISDYLAENSITALQDSVHGLRYVVLIDSSRTKRPTVANSVNVDYAGNILGQVETFDSGKGASFPLSGLIVGWQVLIPYMGVGDKIRMFVPSRYAYGPNANGSIPANAILVFDVSLNSFNGWNDVSFDEQVAIDQAIITDYLVENNITARVDTVHGLRYVLLKQGNENHAINSNNINASFKLNILDESEILQSADSVSLKLSSLIAGWQVLIPYMGEGGSIIMYLPSRFAYGTSPRVGIPANSNVVFEVTLNSIVED
ncbi:MAG: FKBP-type peptidyl-prolyl cis-trans isomerase FkpA [Marinoscillum sp.]|jgi:FKBP-type peptidyl-prolyl cis-trans isomerase FkpA